MTCKSCGKKIEYNEEFCSFCGTKVEKEPFIENDIFLDIPNFQKGGDGQEILQKKKTIIQKKIVLSVAILIVCCMCVPLILLVTNKKKEYSLVGEWHSRDLEELPDAIREFAEKENCPGWVVDCVVDVFGLNDIGKNSTIIFTEDGRFLFSIKGVAVGSNLLSYQRIEEDKILLEISIDASIMGNSIPLSAGYVGEYELNENKLSIDFFGYDINMTRSTEDDD